jgi:hypothetical protein
MRNRLIEQVETEWISFLDDDDTMMENHLHCHSLFMGDTPHAHHLAYSEADKSGTHNNDMGSFESYDVIATWGVRILEDQTHVLFDSCINFEKMRRNRNFFPMTATVRTDLFRSVGGSRSLEKIF